MALGHTSVELHLWKEQSVHLYLTSRVQISGSSSYNYIICLIIIYLQGKHIAASFIYSTSAVNEKKKHFFDICFQTK